ncbi:MAG: VWA domain-containing protein [Hyphomicrobiaceae bacterium]
MADKDKTSVAPMAGVTPTARPVTPVAPADARSNVPAPSSSAEVAAFLERMKTLAPTAATATGRLVFAMDATMSRQPTWDMALGLQADMFKAVKSVGGLDVQLVYFRGAGECRASRWVRDPDQLARLMTTVACQGGYTQIGKVLTHTLTETAKNKVNALVYVGDCMEEQVDTLCARAGELALRGVPVFLFQEGDDRAASAAYAEIARLTKGAHCRFDAGSAEQLKALLTAVAVYAAGGRKALERLSQEARTGGGARKLLGQMR